jgi:hypothetical protein
VVKRFHLCWLPVNFKVAGLLHLPQGEQTRGLAKEHFGATPEPQKYKWLAVVNCLCMLLVSQLP